MIVLFSLLAGGCSTISFKGNCLPRALYQGASWSYQKRQPVRFIVKEVSKGIDHIQCQVLIDGEWLWSSQDADYIYLGDDEYPSAITKKVLTFEDLFKERLEAISITKQQVH